MLRFTNRVMKALADATLGTVIVLVHVLLAQRETARVSTALRVQPRARRFTVVRAGS